MSRTNRSPHAPPVAAHKRTINPDRGQQKFPAGDAERIAERRVKALTLRKSGAHYRIIARECGVSVETAWSDVQAELQALRMLAVAEAEDVREIELRRLDDWTLALDPAARMGDTKAITTLVRCAERRAKLLGLDAPASFSVTTPEGIRPLVIDLTHGRE